MRLRLPGYYDRSRRVVFGTACGGVDRAFDRARRVRPHRVVCRRRHRRSDHRVCEFDRRARNGVPSGRVRARRRRKAVYDCRTGSGLRHRFVRDCRIAFTVVLIKRGCCPRFFLCQCFQSCDLASHIVDRFAACGVPLFL